MNTYKIKKHLQNALENIDSNDYVLYLTIKHLEEQCADEEIELIENDILELPVTEYDSVEDFIKDYQPIFDLVDFQFKDIV